MILARSRGDRVAQAAISAIVRRHPAHSPLAGSIVQTLVQGVSIAT
jgi:hypothetical protein